ncbi:hypothetical protein [Sideroxyarcus sp. TK5]
MTEKFYRNKDGKLVFVATADVSSVQHQRRIFPQERSFPVARPAKLGSDNIWTSFSK